MMDYMLEGELLSSEEESVESPPWAEGNHLARHSVTKANQLDPTEIFTDCPYIDWVPKVELYQPRSHLVSDPADIFEGYPSTQADFSEACQQNASDAEDSERSFRALK